MAKHYDLGKKGENIATAHLREKGYKILKQNWRYGKDEIDIIAEIDDFIVFVEVKTRSTDYFGYPEEAVDDKKERFLIRAADEYIIQKDINKEARFDIISIIIDGNKQSIRHIEDAFYPTL